MVLRNALIVVDVQQGFEHPSWGQGNNPSCVANIERLLEAWRRHGQPVVLVRHDSQSPTSPLRPGQPGNDLSPAVQGPHDLLVTKTVNSAFYGTPSLDDWLRASGVTQVTVCGITTNHCCETTARMAGNLGYETTFVLDATRTFDRVGPDGAAVSADELARVTGANLHGEFATVVSTDAAVDQLSGQR